MNSGVTKLSCRISIACRILRCLPPWVKARPFKRSSCFSASVAAAVVSRGSSRKNSSSTSGLNRKFGGNCHRIGPSFGPSASSSRSKEIRQRLLHPSQLQHVRDVAAALNRKDEIIRSLLRPCRETRRPLQRIERAVDLNGVKQRSRIGQLLLLRQALWIEHAAPRLVGPARNPDAYLSRQGCYPPVLL